MTNVIALDSASRESGRIVYWTAAGDVHLSRLVPALAGVVDDDQLPRHRTAGAALRAALTAYAGRRKLVRPLGQDKRSRGGYAVVNEEANPGDELSPLQHDVAFTARLDYPHQDDVATLVVSPPNQALVAEWERQGGILSAPEVGSWLGGLCAALGSVRLRRSGGVHFVPAPAVPTWTAVSAALEHFGVTCYAIPAVTSADAVRAILAALQDEAQEVLDKVSADLAGMELGESGLANREGLLAKVEAKVSMYEGLLATKLDDLREKLGDLQANLAAAALSKLGGAISENAA